jgi:DNA polymerase-1
MNNLLLVVDGNAIVHRAWHALPPLTAPSGEVVSGAYGFMSILLRALRELKPTHLAVTFDRKGPTFRHEEYEAYKATREKKPDELYAQIPIIERLLADAHIPVYDAKGYEADDAIGTISLEATAADKKLECVILTGDMDTLQLVTDRVRVLTMRKGITDTVFYDEAAVKERYGLTPAQMIDYKALRGDASDNIPGVRGIGEKTATELLSQYGTLEKLYAAVRKGDEKIRATVREKLVAGEKDALQAQNLCRIRRDAPINFRLDDATFTMPTRERMEKSFLELGFMSLLKQLPTGQASMFGDDEKRVAGETTPASADPRPFDKLRAGSISLGEEKYSGPSLVEGQIPTDFRRANATTAKEAAAALKKLAEAPRLAFRSLADAASPFHRPTVIAFAVSDGKTVAVLSGAALKETKPLAKLIKGKVLACHDLKAEIHAARSLGLELPPVALDVMLAAYLLDPGARGHDMTHLLVRRFGVIPLDKSASESDRLDRFAVETLRLLQLQESLSAEIRKLGLDGILEKVEMPTAPVLARMEQRGVRVDGPYLGDLSKEISLAVDKFTKKIHTAAGRAFNINSPAQLKEVLFKDLGISPQGVRKNEKSGGLSTAASELEKLRGEHSIIGDILVYRELAKLKSTYIDALPELIDPADKRLHARFNQAVTATGRLSSSDPNLQNIPVAGSDWGRRVRDAFRAAPGFTLLAADWSQIELRIAAHIAKEQVMIDAFHAGEDIHRRTAVRMFGEENADSMRRVAKVINFGILYGMGPQLLSESANLSFAEARDYIRRYFEIHPAIRAYMDAMRARAADEGFVETLYGRKRFFHNYHLLDRREKGEADRQAINMPIQGTSADMLKDVMIRLDSVIQKKFPADVRLIIQVHDELVFEVRDTDVSRFSGLVKEAMENVLKLDVPIVVDLSTGKKWGEMKKTKK